MNALLSKAPLLADWWTSTFGNLEPNQRFALIVVIVGCATGVICTLVVFVASTVNSIHHRRVESAMKREMIERGMGADEITKIIEAAIPPEDATQRWIASWAKTKKSS
ncbi:MAG TPA: hypothetical protein VHE81_01805 [Lacipirellulaceae bacterium]|nr:hypothetical protein [Lacipirellulaceae bacterium]